MSETAPGAAPVGSNDSPVHFFISYTQADRGWAEWIAWQLEAKGWKVLVQAWDFRHGGNFIVDMQRALERAARVLFVMSPDSLKSPFATAEWAAAIRQDPTGERGVLLPVRVRPCEPRGLLAQVVYVDLVGVSNKDEARRRLLDGVSQLRAKPLHEPDAPPLHALEPGAPMRPAGREPRWPGLTRALRHLAGTFLAAALLALAIRLYLASQLPSLTESTLSITAVILGVMVAVGGSALVGLVSGTLRRRSAAAAQAQGRP
ncbi:MAG: toll/interleukin-1 receptor domain-containing protein [Rubrivivax sp.]|nr:toll/interleukin-1 receptor domain-containing protein [Rubrivivax sp.]